MSFHSIQSQVLSFSTTNSLMHGYDPSLPCCCLSTNKQWLIIYLQCFDTFGIRKSIPPVKNLSDEVLVWLSVWNEVQIICIWFSGCHCHPIISCFIKIQAGLTLQMLAYPGSPGKEAVKWPSKEWVIKWCACTRYQPICLILPPSTTIMKSAACRKCTWWVTRMRVVCRSKPTIHSLYKCLATWTSTAARGSSNKYTSFSCSYCHTVLTVPKDAVNYITKL